MFEVRLHGRGGQGVVTAAELLAVAAHDDGHFAQAFPSFGSERTGAPVVAYCRIAERVIRTREPVVAPDALLVLDPTLVHQVDLFAGLSPEGVVLVNTTRTLGELGLLGLGEWLPQGHLLTVPATELALRHTGRPLPNAALLGGFAAFSGYVSLDGVGAAIRSRFQARPEVAERNVAAASEAYAYVAGEVAAGQGRLMLDAAAD